MLFKLLLKFGLPRALCCMHARLCTGRTVLEYGSTVRHILVRTVHATTNIRSSTSLVGVGMVVIVYR